MAAQKVNVDEALGLSGLPVSWVTAQLAQAGYTVDLGGDVNLSEGEFRIVMKGILDSYAKQRTSNGHGEPKPERPAIRRTPVKAKPKKSKKRKARPMAEPGAARSKRQERLLSMLSLIEEQIEPRGFSIVDGPTKVAHMSYGASILMDGHSDKKQLKVILHTSQPLRSTMALGEFNIKNMPGRKNVWRAFYVEGHNVAALLSEAELAKEGHMGSSGCNFRPTAGVFSKHAFSEKIGKAYKDATAVK